MDLQELQKERALLASLIRSLKQESNRAGSLQRKKRLSYSLGLSSALFLSNRNKINTAFQENRNTNKTKEQR